MVSTECAILTTYYFLIPGIKCSLNQFGALDVECGCNVRKRKYDNPSEKTKVRFTNINCCKRMCARVIFEGSQRNMSIGMLW